MLYLINYSHDEESEDYTTLLSVKYKSGIETIAPHTSKYYYVFGSLTGDYKMDTIDYV